MHVTSEVPSRPFEEEGIAMSNADTHRRLADMFNSRDWDGYAADLAADCEYVDQARSVTVKGRQQCLEYQQAWVTAFSDGG
jgi:hypothetical protein